MSETPNSPVDLSALELDLEKSFAPSWVKEATMPAPLKAPSPSSSDEEARENRGNRERPRLPSRGRELAARGRRPARDGGGRGEGFRREEQGGDRRDRGGQRGAREHGDRRERDANQPPRRPQEPPLAGWNVAFLPEERGVDGLAKQIRASSRTFALFDLCRLILAAPDRFRVRMARAGGPQLFLCKPDGSLWLSENAAANHAFHSSRDKFYRLVKEQIEPPKGNFPVIAQCGVSGALLGPPNHHDYQLRLRRAHSAAAPHMPFDAFASRVRMVREEALIEKWKEEQSTREVVYPLDAEGNPEPEPLPDLSAVAAHFREKHRADAVEEAPEEIFVSGPAASSSQRPIADFLREEFEKLRKFPLPLANFLAREFTTRGLQIFKGREGFTYTGTTRPRFLDRVSQPVSERLSAILDCLSAQKSAARAEQWAALLSIAAGEPAEKEAAEAALLKDLLWLIREGYVVDYHGRNLSVTPRPEKKPPRVVQKQPPRQMAPQIEAEETQGTQEAQEAQEAQETEGAGEAQEPEGTGETEKPPL